MTGNTAITSRRRIPIRLLFFLLAVGSLLISCSWPQAPGSWSWDTHLTVPLGVRTYGVWEMVSTEFEIRRDGSGIRMNTDSTDAIEDSSVFFAAFEEVTVNFRDSLYLDPNYFELTKPVTALFLPVNVNQTDNFSLGRLNPGIGALHGSIQDLPPHPLTASAALSFGANVDYLVVDTGTISITVTNTLPYAVSDIEISASDSTGAQRVLLSNAALAAGAQLSQAAALDDIHFLQTTDLRVSATGEGGSGITVDSSLGLVVNSQIDTLQVSSYHGIIPPQPFYADSNFALDQRNHLTFGIIDTGSITITAINETQLDDTVWVVVPSLLSPLGDTLMSKQFVPAGETRVDTVDLYAYRMWLENEIPQLVEMRMLSWSFATPTHDTFPSQNNRVRGSIALSRLGFNYFEGVLENVALEFPVESTTIERPPEGWEAVRPTVVDGFVTVLSNVGASATTSIDVSTHLAGETIGTRHFDIVNVPLGEDTTVEFYNLTDLLAEYPDSMTTVGQIVVSGTVAIYENEAIAVQVDLRAPLAFTMTPVHAPGEVQKIETADLEDVQDGTARVRIWNRLPVGGHVYLIAAKDSAAVLPHSGLPVDTLAMSDIPVSEIVNGRATGEVYAEFTTSISDSLIEWFRNPPFFTRVDIALPSSDGDTLIAHGSDYVKVQIIADVTYRIDTGDLQ